ncbi:MAG: nicotinate-nucleotide--dimethylbenzimidazole phosphoribosyltransferase [Chloroflexi bacterium]|nr:nicotinate-nucleotide--dimethylbenzimidazole phosphoribosyltransferase [Chloroflexota bacterium]
MDATNIPSIPDLDEAAQQRARERQATRVKPAGALGALEPLSVHLAGMTGRRDWLPERRAVIVFAGDHGVTAHNISTVPQAVTAYMVGQFLAGHAAINVLARQMGARVVVVDAGVNADLSHPDLIDGKIAHGTADFTSGPALTADQTAAAIRLGRDVVQRELARGLDILALGEMGIGNTTPASAIIAAICGRPVAEVTGRGTGIDAAQLAHKIALIAAALRLHAPADDQTLMKVGGLEIGALAGAMIEAASQRIPVVIDGLICTAAALIAQQLKPEVTRFLIAGHQSAEPGHRIALAHLGLDPLLDLDMRLGEGTGAVLALPIIEAAVRTLNEMGALDVG